jgi:cytochrome c553
MFIINLMKKNYVSQLQNDKKHNTPSEQSLKMDLVKSGYSEDIMDKIWKWYNPAESKNSSIK